MPRPRFSEMLVTRRRQLGLSISQASQVLRLKEQVLIAFEEGDFDHIPKSGYAQGMLSSYARYLGLNPRQVTNQFSADLDDYLKSGSSSIASDEGGYGSGSPYVASRGLLPTSGGPAGDLGAFATTSQPHSRQQSTPLVNQRRYVGSLHDEPQRSYGYDAEEELYLQQDQRPYTVRQPTAVQRTRVSSGRTRTRRSGERSQGVRSGGYVRDEVTTRRVIPSQYVDDLRYDDETQPYAAASTRSGRVSSRNIASTRRPNVRRQGAPSRNRDAPRRRGGLVGAVLDFFSDGTHALFALVALLGIVLTAIIIFSVRSCTSGKSQEPSKVVPVTSAQTSQESEGTVDAQDKDATSGEATGKATTDTQADVTSQVDSSTATSTGKTSESTTPKETKVVVSVESGQVSWVEVLCDGESKVATTVTGPWSETYDVHDSITIEVGDTSAVKVTENGVQRQFDSKTSGIGTLSIKGTPLPESETTKTTDEAEADSDKAKTAEDAQEGQDSSSAQTSDEDEFLYTYNGYDIYYNKKNDLYYFFGDDGARYNAADGTPL